MAVVTERLVFRRRRLAAAMESPVMVATVMVSVMCVAFGWEGSWGEVALVILCAGCRVGWGMFGMGIGAAYTGAVAGGLCAIGVFREGATICRRRDGVIERPQGVDVLA